MLTRKFSVIIKINEFIKNMLIFEGIFYVKAKALNFYNNYSGPFQIIQPNPGIL